jgi:hypothetical protein
MAPFLNDFLETTRQEATGRLAAPLRPSVHRRIVHMPVGPTQPAIEPPKEPRLASGVAAIIRVEIYLSTVTSTQLCNPASCYPTDSRSSPPRRRMGQSDERRNTLEQIPGQAKILLGRTAPPCFDLC